MKHQQYFSFAYRKMQITEYLLVYILFHSLSLAVCRIINNHILAINVAMDWWPIASHLPIGS